MKIYSSAPKDAFYLVVLVIIVTGCTIGGNITKSHPANNPGGDWLEVRLNDERIFRGEFLTLREKTIIMLIQKSNGPISETGPNKKLPAVAEVSLHKIESIELINTEKMMMAQGKMTDDIETGKLKFYSRYPQGMDSSLIDRLLKAYQQDSLAVVDK